jgi:hypothetical protein
MGMPQHMTQMPHNARTWPIYAAYMNTQLPEAQPAHYHTLLEALLAPPHQAAEHQIYPLQQMLHLMQHGGLTPEHRAVFSPGPVAQQADRLAEGVLDAHHPAFREIPHVLKPLTPAHGQLIHLYAMLNNAINTGNLHDLSLVHRILHTGLIGHPQDRERAVGTLGPGLTAGLEANVMHRLAQLPQTSEPSHERPMESVPEDYHALG